MSSLHQIGQWLLSTAPPLAEMRGHPDFKNWGEHLVAFGRAEGLAPIQGLLEATAGDALTTMEPLHRFFKDEAQSIQLETYWRASDVAESAIATSPYAAFLLSLISMFGWAAALGERLYQQVNGMPHPGWARIPYACALAAQKIEAIDGARQLVDESYDVLMAAKYQWDSRLRAALTDYRRLAGKIQRKYDMAIANLADELRESCRPNGHHFRAELGAVLWSLGMVPESQLFRATSDPSIVPTRRLYRLVVQQSLDCMAHDSLVQYVWLELKDRPPFNIRDHRSLFARINVRYGQLMLDELYPPVPPSQAYARSLIAWFRGDISREQAGEYLSVYELIHEMFPQVDWLMYLRMSGLAYLLAKQFGWLSERVDAARELEQWHSLADMARSVRENFNQHPEWPEMHSRPNIAMFHVIEDELCETASSTTTGSRGVDKVLPVVERFRASTLSYWLKVAPPILSPEEETELAPLLEKENELLGYLRGAYFLTLNPILPSHYHRYGMILDEMLETRSTPQSQKRFDPDLGRQQLEELSEELKALFLQMQEIVPVYARKRLEPRASLDLLVNAINSHAAQ